MTPASTAIAQMEAQIQQWEQVNDGKALFLSCYKLMTQNMLAAIHQHEFKDPGWVDHLLHHFAEYYFRALHAYQQNPASAPVVWQMAHTVAIDPQKTAISKLLSGVNAHINYDLVLTLADLLEPEWKTLSEEGQSARYADHCMVNEIISRTIDTVQDQILEPAMPVMAWVDTLLGPVDEKLISGLITRWRESVWQNVIQLITLDDALEKDRFIKQVEQEAIRIGKIF